MQDIKETAISIVQGEDICEGTFCILRHINAVKKMAEEYPNDVKIDHINSDGSINATFPASWFKLPKPPRKGREFTEEEKQAQAKLMQEARRKNRLK